MPVESLLAGLLRRGRGNSQRVSVKRPVDAVKNLIGDNDGEMHAVDRNQSQVKERMKIRAEKQSVRHIIRPRTGASSPRPLYLTECLLIGPKENAA